MMYNDFFLNKVVSNMQEISKISWNDVGDRVKQSNEPLYDIIDSNKKLRSHDFEIFRYKYGEVVGDENFFYAPKPSMSKYTKIPFSLVLTNYFEMPINLAGCSIPWKIYKPGDVFPYTRFIPTNQIYEPSNCLSLRSGTNNAFMLINKIADKKWHNLLCKRYNIDSLPPKSFSDHFNIFKALVDSTNNQWRAELLIFPETFFQEASHNHDFKELIFNLSHKDKLFRRNIFAYEILLHKLFMKMGNITSAFVRDCIKHILYVGCGDLPAYFPTENEEYAPISFLTEAYIEGFKSKSCPIVMVPDFLKPYTNSNNAYFSLNNLDYIFKPEKISSQAQIIRNIISGFKQIKEEIIQGDFSGNSILVRTVENFSLSPIIKGEYNFGNLADETFKHICNKNALPFPENSTYLSSCISLSYKNSYSVLE